MRSLVRGLSTACTAAVFLALTGAASAQAQAEAPTAAFRSSGDFRAAMFLTKDTAAFQAAAKKSLSAMAQASTNKAQAGQTLYAAMMFGGCKASVTKTCTVSAVFRITPPKGKPVVSDRVYLWRLKAPDVKSTQLGEHPFAIALDKTDPAGTYAVEVDVLDHNANAAVTLKADFVVTR
jgi:hypothetical protein